MTPEEAIAYIENYTWSTTRLGLDRTRALLSALGDPQKKLRFVHVAGSNGKGSTCAMLERILRSAGYRTGIYISPYIQDFRERIQVSGEYISGADLAAITERVRLIADAMEDHPSQFELVTAIGMEYFVSRHCDVVVLEVGMGGELDSTNAIDAPEAAVITNIGLEHTEYLGNTLSEIAAAKAGIIKPGCDCVCYRSEPEVLAVVERVCAEKGVPFHPVDFREIEPVTSSLEGQIIRRRGEEYSLALLGPHQLRNAAVVLETVDVLRARGWNIPDEAVRTGLKTVTWPARLEVLGRGPLFLLDGGHNPQCAQALAESLHTLLPGRKPVFLTGVLADKDYPGIMDWLAPLASEFICLTPVSHRALPGEKLAEYLLSRGVAARAAADIPEGIRLALTAAGETGAVVAVGSLYLAGAVRTVFPEVSKKWLRRQKIAARDALAPEERAARSAEIVKRILALPEYEKAQTVMLYRSVRGEVQLDGLIASARAAGKRLCYPLCGPDRSMTALSPEGEDAWAAGAFGIAEPDPARSAEIPPEEIDLMLCPCTAFDGEGNRLGMGGGYYDRFLPRCARAVSVSVAFEVQRAEKIPLGEYDRGVDMVITEDAVIRPVPGK